MVKASLPKTSQLQRNEKHNKITPFHSNSKLKMNSYTSWVVWYRFMRIVANWFGKRLSVSLPVWGNKISERDRNILSWYFSHWIWYRNSLSKTSRVLTSRTGIGILTLRNYQTELLGEYVNEKSPFWIGIFNLGRNEFRDKFMTLILTFLGTSPSYPS